MSMLVTRTSPSPVFVVGSLVVACSALVARCPDPGESLEATGFIMEAGGKGFNVALAAHRLGVTVDGLFAVGDDPPGHFMRTAFAAQGLDADLIHTVAAATGAGVGIIQADGENRIAVYPGANASLSVAHVTARADRLRNAGLIFAQFEAPDAPIAAAFALAREAGLTTILNPSPYRAIHREILAATDIIIVNEHEAAALAKDLFWTGPNDGLAALLAADGVRTLIVTHGRHGAQAWERGTLIDQPGFAVEVVSSIGAGDAFAGGLIAALVEGRDFATALRWGCAAGALAVAKLGLATALPNRAALGAMLNGVQDAN
ncbi:MAG: ribokinase [Sphingomonadaceae bacterium]|nr:ribokinase [Sphingomonadaceae bacterium]